MVLRWDFLTKGFFPGVGVGTGRLVGVVSLPLDPVTSHSPSMAGGTLAIPKADHWREKHV